jgi:hypothetical protein
VALHDIAATILDFADLEISEPAATVSLLPFLRTETPPMDRSFVGSHLLYGIDRVAIERDRYKYIYNAIGSGKGSPRSPRPDATHELYDLRSDPEERNNVFELQLERGLALHGELAASVAHSLAGSYALYFVADEHERAEAPKLSGSFALAGGARWQKRPQDFLWPHADGRRGSLSSRLDRKGGQHRVHFELSAPRALLSFRIESGSGPVTASLAVDGEPLALEAISLGSRELTPDAQPFLIPEAPIDRAAPAKLAARVLDWTKVDGHRVLLMRLDDDSDASESGVSGELQSQLEALGYIE